MKKIIALCAFSMAIGSTYAVDRFYYVMGTQNMYRASYPDPYESTRERIEEDYVARLAQIDRQYDEELREANSSSLDDADREYQDDLDAIERLNRRYGGQHNAELNAANQRRANLIARNNGVTDSALWSAGDRRNERRIAARDERDRRLESECHYERMSPTFRRQYYSMVTISEGPSLSLGFDLFGSSIGAALFFRPYPSYRAPSWDRVEYNHPYNRQDFNYFNQQQQGRLRQQTLQVANQRRDNQFRIINQVRQQRGMPAQTQQQYRDNPIRNQRPPVRNQPPPVRNQQPPIRNQQPPVRNQRPPVRNQPPPARPQTPPPVRRQTPPPVRSMPPPPVRRQTPPVRPQPVRNNPPTRNQPPVRNQPPTRNQQPPKRQSPPPQKQKGPPQKKRGGDQN